MSIDKLRIGVIGAGGRGMLARHAHRPEQRIRIVAGCDVSARALTKFRETFGPDVFVTADYRELLARDDIDAVFVTTPDFLHEQHAVAALEAGKHVYLEKPMTITVDGCDNILHAARSSGRKLYLGHNMRHFAVVRKMKQLIERGAIGEPRAGWCRHFISYGGDAYFKDWHCERAKSTGLLVHKAVHDVDVLHWLCGGYTRRVHAMGTLSVYNRAATASVHTAEPDTSWRLENWPPLSQLHLNPAMDVEDLSLMNMELENGALCCYQQCHYAPDGWRNYTIIGTEGRIENFGDSPGSSVVRLWNRRTHYNPYGDEQFYIAPVSGGHGGADPLVVAEFLRYVCEGASVSTSPVAARYSVAACYSATMSLRSGGVPLEVKPLSPDLSEYFERHVNDRVGPEQEGEASCRT